MSITTWLRCWRDSVRRVRATPKRPAARFRPALEALEDRALPSGFTSIVSNFNGTAINPGAFIWFSSNFSVKVVFPASGCEMIANVRRRKISSVWVLINPL